MLARKVAAGELSPNSIRPEALAKQLDTADLPPLDLLIRTSGERRLSNFMLWQATYAVLYFTDTLWPAFNGETLAQALGRASCCERVSKYFSITLFAVSLNTQTKLATRRVTKS